MLGITLVDPIKYNLYFQRFVSEARAESKIINGKVYIKGSLAPDVDIDIEKARRHEVVDFLKNEYNGRVCKISTRGSFKGRILIKECGKAIDNLSETEIISISSKIPIVHGVVQEIDSAYENDEEFKLWCDTHPEVYNIALKLKDLIRNKSTHASGYVVSKHLIENYLPLELSPNEDNELVSSYEMEDIAELTIKLDLLGLKCCSVINEVLNNIDDKLEDLNIDSNPIIYNNLQDLKTSKGIFQIEAETNLRVCNKVKPQNLSELSDVIALARPGAIAFVNDYAACTATSYTPELDNILSETRNLCLYQEQIIFMASQIFGFSLSDGEQLRRCLAKKKKEEVELWLGKIEEKCKEKNIANNVKDLFLKIVEDSSSYSFNKSHSVSYASLTAFTTYLKFKYPLQFFLGLFKHDQEKIEDIMTIIRELPHFNIELLPPHLLKSNKDFSIEGNNIRYGLNSIKGINEKTIDQVLDFKSDYLNKFELFEGIDNSKLNVRVASALIQSGCLDNIDYFENRPKLTLELQLWKILLVKEKALSLQYGSKFDYDLIKTIKYISSLKNEKGKEYISERRLNTIRKKYVTHHEIYKRNSSYLSLANFFYEKTLLGYSFSHKLIDLFKKNDPDLINLEQFTDEPENSYVRLVATLDEDSLESKSRKNQRYLKFSLSDESKKVTGLMFREENINEFKAKHLTMPKSGAIVYCKGRKKDNDTIF